ncbi:unnamed protein product [Closterium sp. Naga37s-1]|nr:unnamed protein product [Closterium sp. Naga37s-1]
MAPSSTAYLHMVLERYAPGLWAPPHCFRCYCYSLSAARPVVRGVEIRVFQPAVRPEARGGFLPAVRPEARGGFLPAVRPEARDVFLPRHSARRPQEALRRATGTRASPPVARRGLRAARTTGARPVRAAPGLRAARTGCARPARGSGRLRAVREAVPGPWAARSSLPLSSPLSPVLLKAPHPSFCPFSWIRVWGWGVWGCSFCVPFPAPPPPPSPCAAAAAEGGWTSSAVASYLLSSHCPSSSSLARCDYH